MTDEDQEYQELATVMAAKALARFAEPEPEYDGEGDDWQPPEDEEPVVRVPHSVRKQRAARPTVSKERRGMRPENWDRGSGHIYQGGLVRINGEVHVVSGVRSNGVINLESGELFYPDEYDVVRKRPAVVKSRDDA